VWAARAHVHTLRDSVRDAEEWLDKSLAAISIRLGDESSSLVGCLCDLAEIRRLQGKCDQARQLLLRAKAIANIRCGSESDKTADVLAAEARLLSDCEDPAASNVLERALVIRRRVYGQRHPFVAALLFEAAAIRLEREEWAEAEMFAEEGMHMLNGAVGNDHYLRAEGAHLLARALHGRQKLEDGQRYAEEAIRIRQATFGDQHHAVGESRYVLGCILRDRNDYVEAAREMEVALKIQETVLGRESPLAVEVAHGFGVLRMREQKLDDAEPLLRRALVARSKALGKGNMKLQESVRGLCDLLRLSNRADEADRLLAQFAAGSVSK